MHNCIMVSFYQDRLGTYIGKEGSCKRSSIYAGRTGQPHLPTARWSMTLTKGSIYSAGEILATAAMATPTSTHSSVRTCNIFVVFPHQFLMRTDRLPRQAWDKRRGIVCQDRLGTKRKKTQQDGGCVLCFAGRGKVVDCEDLSKFQTARFVSEYGFISMVRAAYPHYQKNTSCILCDQCRFLIEHDDWPRQAQNESKRGKALNQSEGRVFSQESWASMASMTLPADLTADGNSSMMFFRMRQVRSPAQLEGTHSYRQHRSNTGRMCA